MTPPLQVEVVGGEMRRYDEWQYLHWPDPPHPEPRVVPVQSIAFQSDGLTVVGRYAYDAETGLLFVEHEDVVLALAKMQLEAQCGTSSS